MLRKRRMVGRKRWSGRSTGYGTRPGPGAPASARTPGRRPASRATSVPGSPRRVPDYLLELQKLAPAVTAAAVARGPARAALAGRRERWAAAPAARAASA